MQENRSVLQLLVGLDVCLRQSGKEKEHKLLSKLIRISLSLEEFKELSDESVFEEEGVICLLNFIQEYEKEIAPKVGI